MQTGEDGNIIIHSMRNEPGFSEQRASVWTPHAFMSGETGRGNGEPVEGHRKKPEVNKRLYRRKTPSRPKTMAVRLASILGTPYRTLSKPFMGEGLFPMLA